MTPDDKLTIDTPEQTRLEFNLAGVGSRFLALAFDTLVQTIAGLAMWVLALLWFAGSFAFWPSGWQWAVASLLLVWFFLTFCYFAFFEALWNGQTPGKRYTHLRVIKDSGRPITAFEAIARNLVRIVDQLPGVYAVGIFSVILSRQNKRLGDFVAGTVVVHEKPFEEVQALQEDAAKDESPGLNVAQISAEELQLIEAYLQRRPSLDASLRKKMASEISYRIANKLGLSPEEWRDAEAFLERLAAERRSIARYE